MAHNQKNKRMARTPLILLAVCGAGAIGAFSSCSSEDSLNDAPEEPATHSSDAIGYNVTAENASRASQVYNSNNIPTKFNISVWSIESGGKLGKEYIHWDQIVDQNPKGAHNWVDQNGVRYWPNNGEMLNFFASTATAGGFADIDSLDPDYRLPITVPSDAEAQTDLLYATAYRQKKTATGASGQSVQKVNLAFHHALSQVVFTAQSTNSHIAVYIGNISIVGPSATGTFTIPVLHSDGNPAWTIPANYAPGTFSASTFTNSGAPLLTSTPLNLTAGSDQTQEAFMMIPQSVAAAVPTDANPWSGSKAYLKLDCLIYNVAKDSSSSKESTFDTMIFGQKTGDMDNFDSLYIPIDINWQMGNRYVYNLTFGSGNGGYKSDGTAALVPVKYAVTVDNWAEGGTAPIAEPTVN